MLRKCSWETPLCSTASREMLQIIYQNMRLKSVLILPSIVTKQRQPIAAAAVAA